MLRRKLNAMTNDDNDDVVKRKQIKLTKNQQQTTSNYFSSHITTANAVSQQFLNIQARLNHELSALNFAAPVHYIYNPVEYAAHGNELYVRRYCGDKKRILFVGMNPGPFGMCQTGVPFGAVPYVRDWLDIVTEDIGKPADECPKRPIQGFACARIEESGARLWTLFQTVSGTPDNFFRHSFVYNYCPLAFMKENGCNVTPSELKKIESKELESKCDSAYCEIIRLLQPDTIVGIGRYVENRTKSILKTIISTTSSDQSIRILCLTHPSPRVVGNNNWLEKAERFLIDNNLIDYLKPPSPVINCQ